MSQKPCFFAFLYHHESPLTALFFLISVRERQSIRLHIRIAAITLQLMCPSRGQTRLNTGRRSVIRQEGATVTPANLKRLELSPTSRPESSCQGPPWQRSRLRIPQVSTTRTDSLKTIAASLRRWSLTESQSTPKLNTGRCQERASNSNT